MTSKKSHTKLIVLLLSLVATILFVVMYFGILSQTAKPPASIKIDGLYLSSSMPIEAFQLTDNHNKPFTETNLQGKWTMIFFGFTNCGMVCPTTLSELNKMYKTLQHTLPDAKLPQVVLISVDPDRDSVARLNEYVNAFNPHFLGTRADGEQIERLKKQFHIVAVKMQTDGQSKDHYTINHSAEIMLINPQGRLQAFMSYPHMADQMVKDYQLILSSQARS